MAACPYHARKFNWWDPVWPADMKESLNPSVSVRMRGVVEKCSFCFHRYQLAKEKAFIEQTKAEGMKVENKLTNNLLTVNSVKEVQERVEGLGGGFQYCELTEPLLDDFGLLSEHVNYEMLAKHIYFTEFGIALPQDSLKEEDNYVGNFKNTELYIYLDKDFNISEFNKIINEETENFIVYADTWSISTELLNQHNITIKKLPTEIKGA